MTDAREAILSLIEEQIDPSGPWIGRTYLREELRKSKYDVEVHDDGKDEFDRAFEELRSDLSIVVWHGLVTLGDEDHLNGAIQAAAEGSVTQKVLIGKLNKVKAGAYDPAAEVE